jgi:hypothetical protein
MSVRRANRKMNAPMDIIRYVIGDLQFRLMEALLNFFGDLHSTLRSEDYRDLMNKVIIALTKHTHEVDRDTKLFYDFRTRPPKALKDKS